MYAPELIRQSLRMMLRPVVRLCIKHGLDIHEASEALKATFVKVAQSEIERSGEKINVSRVSILTGLHRRDVDRLMGASAEPLEHVSFVSKVINTWENNAEFQTKAGKPRVLTHEGEGSEFSRLVRALTKDFHAKGVLLQLERLNLVTRTGTGLRLQTGAYNVRRDLGKGYHVLAQDLEDLSLGVEQNLLGTEVMPNLHARTEFDNVFTDSLPVIKEWILKEGSAFHQRAREFLSQHDQDVNPHIRNEAGKRVVITSFSRSDGTP